MTSSDEEVILSNTLHRAIILFQSEAEATGQTARLSWASFLLGFLSSPFCVLCCPGPRGLPASSLLCFSGYLLSLSFRMFSLISSGPTKGQEPNSSPAENRVSPFAPCLNRKLVLPPLWCGQRQGETAGAFFSPGYPALPPARRPC